MRKHKAGATPPETYTELAWEEKREQGNALRREMILLTRKVGRNPLATAYYAQMKDILEDLLMMELAQKAVESTMKCNTQNKILQVSDAALGPFRAEMDRAKTLKLASGVLSMSGHQDVDGALERLTDTLYGPRKETKKDSDKAILSQLQEMLESYAKKVEKSIKDAALISKKRNSEDI